MKSGKTRTFSRRVLWAATAATAALAVTLTGTSAQAAAGSDRLNANEQLNPGQRLVDPYGQFVLTMQGDGNLVEYGPGNRALWASGTNHSNSIVRMQSDGNLVIIAPGNVPVWSTGTGGNPNADLELQIDGNIVVYAQGHVARWSTGVPTVSGGRSN